MGKVLYLGTDTSFAIEGKDVVHYRVIQPTLRDCGEVQDCLAHLHTFSHFLITSKHTVYFLFLLGEKYAIDMRSFLTGKCISIGPATTVALQKNGIEPLWEALEFSQEGIIQEMEKYLWENAHILYPRSSLARAMLSTYLLEKRISYQILDLYDTIFITPKHVVHLEEIEEIIFTSPSTVEGFFRLHSHIPTHIKCTFQGKVTQEYYIGFISGSLD